ncbi:MAG: c-type cytochrome [Bacteroidota bacterium]
MKTALVLLIFVFAGYLSLHAQSGAAMKASLERGKALYEQYCLVCHQADGSGVQNLNPPLIKTKWVQGDKSELIRIILKGLDTEIEVDGDIYNNVMPPVDYLSDQEIADVLTYVRNNFSNKASAITAVEVKTLRAKLLK